MSKMPCHITDGPQEPGDDRMYLPEEDPDEAYDRMRQNNVDKLPTLQEKTGEATGMKLYSYDGRYWFATPVAARHFYRKIQQRKRSKDND